MQQAALDWVADQSALTTGFYLSGGTALAEFYLHHRYSEDLDFFSPDEFDPTELQPYLARLKTHLGATSLGIENRLNRNLFFFETAAETLKVEFSWFVGAPIEPGLKHRTLRIDSQLDLAVNKLFTIYQRPRARDYVDLFYLLPKHPIAQLVELARLKFDWQIDLLQLATRFNEPDLTDYPRMIKPLAPEAVRASFRKLALSLGDQIVE
jgi:predicted nucleotidyltransferase component of viral defense system